MLETSSQTNRCSNSSSLRPNEDTSSKKDRFHRQLEKVFRENKKAKDSVIVMEDFYANLGEQSIPDIVVPYSSWKEMITQKYCTFLGNYICEDDRSITEVRKK